MPPKLTRSAKQSLIVTHLQTSQTCHTLKELEKSLPAVASINGMQVKEYIQELADEGRIRVEKIGSGNWYWSFAGDERGEKERARRQLQDEVERAQAAGEKTAGKLAARREAIERELNEEKDEEELEKVRKELVERKKALEEEYKRVRKLKRQMQEEEGGGGGKSVAEMKADTDKFRTQAQMWTDNVYVLETYLRRLAGGDGEIIAAVQRECYGEEYVEGEGLREME